MDTDRSPGHGEMTKPTFGEAAKVWGKLGVLSFGGRRACPSHRRSLSSPHGRASGPYPWLRRCRRPTVGLLGCVAAPAVDVIMLIPCRHRAARDRWRDMAPARPSDKKGETGKSASPLTVSTWHPPRARSGRPQPSDSPQADILNHRIEGAVLAAVAPECVLDREGRRGEPLGDRPDLGGGREQEDGFGINKSPHQPGAGDAVDLRPRAGELQACAGVDPRRRPGSARTAG